MMLESLGLGGDGDEWDAVWRVEAAFGVRLDHRDAPEWWTVGDVFASLLNALAEEGREPDETWQRFVAAIAAESGAAPRQVTPETRLLAVPLWEHVGRRLRRLAGR